MNVSRFCFYDVVPGENMSLAANQSIARNENWKKNGKEIGKTRLASVSLAAVVGNRERGN